MDEVRKFPIIRPCTTITSINCRDSLPIISTCLGLILYSEFSPSPSISSSSSSSSLCRVPSLHPQFRVLSSSSLFVQFSFENNMENESSSFWSPGIDLEYLKKNSPPGFRFKPTYYELLDYLLWKQQGRPIANIIKEIPQDKCYPDELKCEFSNWNEDEFYFFTEAKLLSGKRVDRKVGNGTWRSGTGATAITHGSKTVGYKTTLTFAYSQKGNKRKNTIWNMHEYRLPHQSGKRKGRDNLVLCKIYKRRVSGKTCDALDEENTSISSMANNETDTSIGSCISRQPPTIVSNGSEQMLSDVSSTECIEINYQSPQLTIEDVNCLKWIEGILMDEEVGNDPLMSTEELNPSEEEWRIICGL